MADTFVPVTFVPDELLTSTKMNQLSANQAAFHDGNGFSDSIIAARHMGARSVTGLTMATHAFRAVRGTNFNTPINGQTSNFTFDVEQFDIGNWYDPTTGLATAPYGGMYLFSCSFFVETVQTRRAFIIPRGTATSATTPAGRYTTTRINDIYLPSDGSLIRHGGTFMVYMSAGSTFGLDIWTSSANNLNSLDTFFSGVLLSRV